ncbi:WcaA Glycosyltransferases involved in cell wall biogenesis [Candidatus Nanopelagicaceae bacterium]
MKISVITPCFNEELNIDKCILETVKVMEAIGQDYEHIFCDNASSDSTVAIIKEHALRDPRIKLIVNSRNVGPFRNMWIGLQNSSGDAVIPFLPADLQDPPSVIRHFVHEWKQGAQIVYGVRENRNERFLLRLSRGIYYRVIAKMSRSNIPPHVGEFLLADRKVIDSILSVDDEYPYIRGLIAQTAIPAKYVRYTWAKRASGKSKLGYLQLIDQGLNGFVSTTRIPARLMLLVGFIAAFTGIMGAMLTAGIILFSDVEVAPGIPTIIVGMLFFGGLQMFFIGLIGEYVLSIHNQVRRSPPVYAVEKINL